MLYAVLVNVVMEQVILRFTPLGAMPFNLANAYINWVIFGILFGTPIAYNAYSYYGINK